MVTTSYPRWAGDVSGSFVADLAWHLVNEQNLQLKVVAPADPRAPVCERVGQLEVRRLRYFVPSRLQKLAYGDGIPWNLRRSWLPWLNTPSFLSVFAWELCACGKAADIVHAHWGILGAVAVLTRPVHGCPVLLTVHGSDWRSKMASIRWITRWAVKHADAVLTPSREFHQEMLRVRRDPRYCQFLPNGVDIPSTEEMQRRHASSASERNARIVSVGRLIAERKHDLLIRVFGRVKRRFPSATLTLVGGGNQQGLLENLIQELNLSDSVRLAGRVPPSEVPQYLYSADLYVSPTTIDSFGIATVEAAAHGLPVVTTRVGFAAELVMDGLTGYVVPPGDERALENAIVKMLQDPARMREAGRRMRARVERLGLTWSENARRTAELYTKLVGCSMR